MPIHTPSPQQPKSAHGCSSAQNYVNLLVALALTRCMYAILHGTFAKRSQDMVAGKIRLNDKADILPMESATSN